MKQQSTEWKNICKQCVITASTAYNAMGLRSVKAMSDHFDEYIYKKDPQLFSEEVLQRLKHGSEHEVTINI